MTREEAIKAFEEIKANAQNNLGKKYAAGCEGYYRDKIELADAALSALRPVSRERVEKVWRGEWQKDIPMGYKCNSCEGLIVGQTPFCPVCGKAMTDKAVEMVMERLEEICK